MSAISANTQFINVDDMRFAYRKFGLAATRPVVFFNHLAANLDNFDPAVLNGIADERTVVTFDNRGVGSSTGDVPKTIEQMADDAALFIQALGVGTVDVLALSMGGMVAQELALRHPSLINKLIFVGTGPRGGKGISKVTATTLLSILKAALTRSDPKEFIFFRRNQVGKAAAKKFLERLEQRKVDRDLPVSVRAFRAQLTAISTFGKTGPASLASITQPSLVINGDHDIMVPSELSVVLADALPNATLEIYSDAGHGSLFQQPERFVNQALDFLKQ
jgi:pimeloyl-ACP methyl ester carboxylesterase